MLVKIMLCKFCNNLESKSQCVNMIIYPILQLQKEKKNAFLKNLFLFLCFTHGIFLRPCFRSVLNQKFFGAPLQ